MATNEIPRADDSATKFLFDLSFDEEARGGKDCQVEQEAEPEIPPPPPEPTFSEADLTAARAQGFEEGHAAGLNEAGAGIEQRASAAMDAIAGKLADLGTKQDETNGRAMKDLIALNRRILEMLIPAYMERHGADEIDALVAECLTRVLDPGEIVVEVPSDAVEALEPRLRETATTAGFSGSLEIRTAADLTAGDVRLFWQNGGAARQTDEIWAEISEAVDRAIHSLGDSDGPALETGQPDPAGEDTPPPQVEPAIEEAPGPDGTALAATESDDNTPRPDAAIPDVPAGHGTV